LSTLLDQLSKLYCGVFDRYRWLGVWEFL